MTCAHQLPAKPHFILTLHMLLYSLLDERLIDWCCAIHQGEGSADHRSIVLAVYLPPLAEEKKTHQPPLAFLNDTTLMWFWGLVASWSHMKPVNYGFQTVRGSMAF